MKQTKLKLYVLPLKGMLVTLYTEDETEHRVFHEDRVKFAVEGCLAEIETVFSDLPPSIRERIKKIIKHWFEV